MRWVITTPGNVSLVSWNAACDALKTLQQNVIFATTGNARLTGKKPLWHFRKAITGSGDVDHFWKLINTLLKLNTSEGMNSITLITQLGLDFATFWWFLLPEFFLTKYHYHSWALTERFSGDSGKVYLFIICSFFVFT